MNKLLLSVLIRPVAGLVMIVSSAGLCAEEIKSPEFIEGVEKVTAEDVFKLIREMDDLIIVDSRIKGDRAKGYLESSLSLPDTQTSCKTLAKIIPKKTHPSLFYCNGIKCGRSAVAIEIAKKCGYKNIYWFRGGFEMWEKKGFPFIKK